jgi:hypothetical protein
MRSLIRVIRDLPNNLRSGARARGRDLRAQVCERRAADLRVMEELGPDAVERWAVEQQNTTLWQYEELMLRVADALDPNSTDGS